MPLLVCGAVNCAYNKEEYCSKGDIKVGGESAKQKQETCCESFMERKGDYASNTTGTASETISVACEACNCAFNESYKCAAGKIGIVGASACACEQTECGSFEKIAQ